MSLARLTQGAIILTLAGSIGAAVLRGEDASVRIPSKEEWRLNSLAEWPEEPANLTEFLGVGSHRGVTRTVAIVEVGPITAQRPEERAPQTGPTPPPMGRGASTDYEVTIEEVLSPSSLHAGETVTLRKGGEPNPRSFTPYPHPIEGQRLLLVLVPDRLDAARGVFTSYPYGTANITGDAAHLADVWRTSVSEMGAPTSTPAFIDAVRAALR